MENNDGIWNMKNAGKVKPFINLLNKRKSEENQSAAALHSTSLTLAGQVQQIIDEFEAEVLPELKSQAPQCIIHVIPKVS